MSFHAALPGSRYRIIQRCSKASAWMFQSMLLSPPRSLGPIAVSFATQRLIRFLFLSAWPVVVVLSSRTGSRDHHSMSASLWTAALVCLSMPSEYSQYRSLPRKHPCTMRFRPKYWARLSPIHCLAMLRTLLIFSPHHLASLNSFPIGTPREIHHPSWLAHLMLCPRSCPRYFPIPRPSRFLMFSRMPVALHQRFKALVTNRSSAMSPMKMVVSSANWRIL